MSATALLEGQDVAQCLRVASHTMGYVPAAQHDVAAQAVIPEFAPGTVDRICCQTRKKGGAAGPSQEQEKPRFELAGIFLGRPGARLSSHSTVFKTVAGPASNPGLRFDAIVLYRASSTAGHNRFAAFFSVAIPVATRGQTLARRGTEHGPGSARASSAGTLWRAVAGQVTDSPLPHQLPSSPPTLSSEYEPMF
jgi:hypothetical protein